VPHRRRGDAAQTSISGNGSEVLIGRDFAGKHVMLAPTRIVAQQSGGGIGGPVKREIVVLSSLVIAGAEFQDVRAAIDPERPPGRRQHRTSILRRFALVIDFRSMQCGSRKNAARPNRGAQ